MLIALLCLLACQLAGEFLREAAGLPIPGPVVGMILLAALLALRGIGGTGKIPEPLRRTSEALLGLMGLLFVPAGVGIVAQAGVLRKEWLPIFAAIFGSTFLSLLVTGTLMHWAVRRRAGPGPGKTPRGGENC